MRHKIRQPGRAVFYSRDSGGRHETTPGEYVLWAQRQAKKHGVAFSGTPEGIEEMIRAGAPVSGDLFFDDGVRGDYISRPVLDRLLTEVKLESRISHVFIPRRDRLARPNNPLDGMQLERQFTELGLTLVFMDRVLNSTRGRTRSDLGEAIGTLIDYDKSGRDRMELAQKLIYSQLSLAKSGYSIGGRPPFGFRRWLVTATGVKVRELLDGERNRMVGHHVVWLLARNPRLH